MTCLVCYVTDFCFSAININENCPLRRRQSVETVNMDLKVILCDNPDQCEPGHYDNPVHCGNPSLTDCDCPGHDSLDHCGNPSLTDCDCPGHDSLDHCDPDHCDSPAEIGRASCRVRV